MGSFVVLRLLDYLPDAKFYKVEAILRLLKHLI